jgi:hypothetical protein
MCTVLAVMYKKEGHTQHAHTAQAAVLWVGAVQGQGYNMGLQACTHKSAPPSSLNSLYLRVLQCVWALGLSPIITCINKHKFAILPEREVGTGNPAQVPWVQRIQTTK